MPDISMCENEDCERRYKCLRYTATPWRYGQCYAEFEEEDCDSFMSNY